MKTLLSDDENQTSKNNGNEREFKDYYYSQHRWMYHFNKIIVAFWSRVRYKSVASVNKSFSNVIKLELLILLFILYDYSAEGKYETSWHFYNEERCCLSEKHNNKRDFISTFTCGELFYRALYVDDSNGFLYVGGMDNIFRLQLEDISQGDCKRDSLYLEATDVSKCIISGKSQDYECRNHVRIIEDIGDNLLYVCGTNAHNPRDLVIYKDLKHLPRHIHLAKVGRGQGRCPSAPDSRFTTLWGPGGLYSANKNGDDHLMTRWDLRNSTHPHDYLRTIKYDTKWMDSPVFISLQQMGDHVYLLMRETDNCVSYTNGVSHGLSRISVAARVCVNDRGSSRDKRHWTSFVKARITCSAPHYDQLENVYKIPGDESRIYAIFTSASESVMAGSVICFFSQEQLNVPFDGPFSEWTSGGRSRFPLNEDKTPNPKPGKCSEDSTKLSDSVINFVRTHPMVYEMVNPEFGGPIYIQKDVIFTSLVVDKLSRADNNYTVIFAATNTGKIYKIIQWIKDQKSESFLQDVWDVHPNSTSITSMVFSKIHQSLYVSSDSILKQIKFSGVCLHQYDGCVRCSRDPYCGWDVEEQKCFPYEDGLFQDISDTSVNGCDDYIKMKQIPATFGQSIHLGTYYEMPFIAKDEEFTWFKHGKNDVKREVIERSDKYILTAARGLVIVSLNQLDVAVFECRQGRRLLAVYNLTVDNSRCTSPPKQNDSYNRIYLDWCREFMKHKEAMKKWQSKSKQQCKKNQLEWGNYISNEVVPDF